ncbi:MAG: GlsB/YeaQ/YmgE family stress response membrane protein [Deltaproteobacteria bacterium]|nr:GlsB/YeaQ/YmgE family stress response membrane protein [Deltaproteobacteria bacterium]
MGAVLKVISAVISGLVIGALARLVLPGEQDIGIVRTMGYGMVGALVGGLIADQLHLMWLLRLGVQVTLAAGLVTFTARNRLKGP